MFDDGCGDCCYRCRDFCWCLLCVLILLAIALVVVLVVAFGFVVQPSVTVDDAALTRLALAAAAPTTALAYNLSLVLVVRNRNWAMSMKNVEPLEAAYKFDGQQFDRVQIADKGARHGPKKTVVYRLSSGSDAAAASLGNAGVAEFKKENATGTFEVEVAVSGKVSYTARITKCKIELAPPGQAPAALVFEKVKCKLAKAEKNC
uniref:Late embryogenesis abundant protein LEA-2 subgroup domain-containing protein n=1 Tax=Oryza brachyantha TaxID=4533 RepID=J3MJT1_ORYBR